MKVFISHQQRDAALAFTIGEQLKKNSIEIYLDIIDPFSSQNGDNLAEYIRSHLGQCNSLMAVVSDNTKTSWWVPWEIGIATEKSQFITTYAGDNTELPQYLKKWPYLRSLPELDTYIRYLKDADRTVSVKQFGERKSLSQSLREAVPDFHRQLKSALRQ